MGQTSPEARLLAGIYWMIRGVIISSVIGGLAIVVAAQTDSAAVLAGGGALSVVILVVYLFQASSVANATNFEGGEPGGNQPNRQAAASEPELPPDAVPFDRFIQQNPNRD